MARLNDNEVREIARMQQKIDTLTSALLSLHLLANGDKRNAIAFCEVEGFSSDQFNKIQVAVDRGRRVEEALNSLQSYFGNRMGLIFKDENADDYHFTRGILHCINLIRRAVNPGDRLWPDVQETIKRYEDSLRQEDKRPGSTKTESDLVNDIVGLISKYEKKSKFYVSEVERNAISLIVSFAQKNPEPNQDCSGFVVTQALKR